MNANGTAKLKQSSQARTAAAKIFRFTHGNQIKINAIQDIQKADVDFPSYVCKNLHLDVETADVNFIFDMVDPVDGTITTKKLPAHKNILAGGSDVFRSMFYGSLKEAEDITIKDFSYDGFCEFINLFYLADAKLSKENIFEVIRALDKYDARKCLPRCDWRIGGYNKRRHGV